VATKNSTASDYCISISCKYLQQLELAAALHQNHKQTDSINGKKVVEQLGTLRLELNSTFNAAHFTKNTFTARFYYTHIYFHFLFGQPFFPQSNVRFPKEEPFRISGTSF